VNNKAVLKEEYRNSVALNIFSLLIVGITVFLGVNNIQLALGKLDLSIFDSTEFQRYGVNIIVAFSIMLLLGNKIFGRK